MTYEEAMRIVDAGGFVSREPYWQPVEAGFSWGVWVSRERVFSTDDMRRMREYDYTKDKPVVATGPYYRTNHTLCETWTHQPDKIEEAAQDWFDASEHFEDGWLKAHTEYLAESRAAAG